MSTSTDVALPEGAHLAPAGSAGFPSDDEVNSMWRIAKALAASGMFKDVKQAEQAFGKMVVGRDLGLTPAQSMTGLYIVEGKPQVAAPLLGHFIRSTPGYDYEVTEISDEACTIVFRVEGKKDKESRFTKEDAEKAKLTGKDVWQKYPRNMLFARAMSNGAKWFVPETMGGLPVYVEGEIEAPADPSDATGSGEAPGIELPQTVLAVIERATDLGHAGLSNRATIEMALGGQPDDLVANWVIAANAELDAIEKLAEPVTEAVVVPEGDGPTPQAAEAAETLKLREIELDRLYADAEPGRELDEVGEELEGVRTLIRNLGFTPMCDLDE